MLKAVFEGVPLKMEEIMNLVKVEYRTDKIQREYGSTEQFIRFLSDEEFSLEHFGMMVDRLGQLINQIPLQPKPIQYVME